MSLPHITVEPLNRSHNRDGFDCGVVSLNNYLQRLAVQQAERRISRTFVAVPQEEEARTRILGYYTLATGRVAFENVPTDKKLPPQVPVPVVLLGRLAVATVARGQGLGEMLLFHALWRSQQIAAHAGVYAVEVDALDESASAFYQKYGFKPLLDNPLHLYLSLRDVETLGIAF